MDNNSSCLVTGMVFIKGLFPRRVQVLHGGLQVELARQDVDQVRQVPAQEGPPVLRPGCFRGRGQAHLISQGKQKAILLYQAENLLKLWINWFSVTKALATCAGSSIEQNSLSALSLAKLNKATPELVDLMMELKKPDI